MLRRHKPLPDPQLIEGAGTGAPPAVFRAAGKTAVMVLQVSECYREIQAPRRQLIDRDGALPACTTELGSLKARRQAPLPEAGLDTWEEAETESCSGCPDYTEFSSHPCSAF